MVFAYLELHKNSKNGKWRYLFKIVEVGALGLKEGECNTTKNTSTVVPLDM